MALSFDRKKAKSDPETLGKIGIPKRRAIDNSSSPTCCFHCAEYFRLLFYTYMILRAMLRDTSKHILY